MKPHREFTCLSAHWALTKVFWTNQLIKYAIRRELKKLVHNQIHEFMDDFLICATVYSFMDLSMHLQGSDNTLKTGKKTFPFYTKYSVVLKYYFKM